MDVFPLVTEAIHNQYLQQCIKWNDSLRKYFWLDGEQVSNRLLCSVSFLTSINQPEPMLHMAVVVLQEMRTIKEATFTKRLFQKAVKVC